MSAKNIDLKSLPTYPGVYQFIDKDQNIVYIGKAKNIKKRVKSYFQNSSNLSPKTAFLVSKINKIQHIITNNEVEALLLENKLIKKHQPKYNISLKDSKSYAYIKISNHPFPRISSARNVNKTGTFFGPFTDGTARHKIINLTTKLFKLRTCKTLPKKACLNYHINICTAPCINKVTTKEYDSQVKQATQFIKGKNQAVLKQIEHEMQTASKNQNYELALEKRNQKLAIEHLHEKQTVDLIKNYNQDVISIVSNKNISCISLFKINKGVISGKKEYRFEYQDSKHNPILEEFIKLYYSKKTIPSEVIVNQNFWKTANEKEILESYLSKIKGIKVKLTFPKFGQKKLLTQLAQKNALHSLNNTVLKQLQNVLNLSIEPAIIECFDISNLGSEHIVAGMTQFKYGSANRAAYRKYEIRSTLGKQDDFAAMREVIYRRYNGLQKEIQKNLGQTQLPDLIIVDGGPGQLSSALSQLKKLNLQIPIIGLAKKEELIYTPNDLEPIKLDKNSKLMLLLRKIRDATHKLAISYNRKKREMKLKKQIKK